MSEIVIHAAAGSPYCRAALLGLEEKRSTLSLRRGNGWLPSEARSTFRKNPFARVPVLDHGDFRLYETQAILRYLDAILPGPALQPKEPKALARMSQIANIVDWYVTPSIVAWDNVRAFPFTAVLEPPDRRNEHRQRAASGADLHPRAGTAEG